MNGIYLTADLHLGHEKVAGLRGFDSAVEHDRHVMEALHYSMPARSTLYVLGDLCMDSQRKYALDRLWRFRALMGHTMHLVFGNHDAGHSMHRKARRRELQMEYLEAFDTIGDSAVLRHNRENIFLNHFPYSGDHTEEDRYAQWRLPDLGVKLIHGHTHQATPTTLERPNQVCVSWEAWGYPVHLDQVMAEFEGVADE